MVKILYRIITMLSIVFILIVLIFRLFHWPVGYSYYIIFLLMLLGVFPLFLLTKRINKKEKSFRFDLIIWLISLTLFVLLTLYPRSNYISPENADNLFNKIERNLFVEIATIKNETDSISKANFDINHIKTERIINLKNKTDSLSFKMNDIYEQVYNTNSEIASKNIISENANFLKTEIIQYQEYILDSLGGNKFELDLMIDLENNIKNWEVEVFDNSSRQIILTTIKQLECNLRKIENEIIKKFANKR